MTDTTCTLVAAVAAITERHGGEWTATHEAFADRLVEAIEDAGGEIPGAAEAFRFFAAAFTAAGRSFPLADGRRLVLRLVPCTVVGAPDEVIEARLFGPEETL